MTVKKIREIPSALPKAHLYLDDIEEISRILLEAFQPDPEADRQPRIVYIVGDCEMDSINDLSEHGGRVTGFRLEICEEGNEWSSASVRMYEHLNPELRIHSRSEQTKWSVYSKINAIFEGRRIKHFVSFRKSYVNLINFRERSKAAAEARRGYIRDILLLVVGGIVTFIGQLIIAKLRK